jgi:hypothetical protein
MQRHGRALAVVIGALSVVAFAGATALAGKGLKTKSATESIDPGENGSATAKCKRGTKAVSGGFEAEFDPAGAIVLTTESRRTSGREWGSTAYSASPEAGDLTSFAYCRDQKLKTKSATTEVDPGELASVTARCRRGEKAVSGGFSADEIASGGPQFLLVRSLKQGKREWTVAAYNAGSAEGDLTAYVHCHEGKRVKTREAEGTLGSGEIDSVEARCKRKETLLAGGFDNGSNWTTTGAYQIASHRSGKRSWEVTAYGLGVDRPMTAYAYCEKKKKKK